MKIQRKRGFGGANFRLSGRQITAAMSLFVKELLLALAGDIRIVRRQIVKNGNFSLIRCAVFHIVVILRDNTAHIGSRPDYGVGENNTEPSTLKC